MAAFVAYAAHLAVALIASAYLWQYLATRGEINMLLMVFAVPLAAATLVAVTLSFAIRGRALLVLGLSTLAMACSVVLCGFVQVAWVAMLALVPVGVVLTLLGCFLGDRAFSLRRPRAP